MVIPALSWAGLGCIVHAVMSLNASSINNFCVHAFPQITLEAHLRVHITDIEAQLALEVQQSLALANQFIYDALLLGDATATCSSFFK